MVERLMNEESYIVVFENVLNEDFVRVLLDEHPTVVPSVNLITKSLPFSYHIILLGVRTRESEREERRKKWHFEKTLDGVTNDRW